MKFMESKPSSLLASSDAKTPKGEKLGYKTGVMYLFPHKAFGFNICANAERAECDVPCLNLAGRGAFSNVQESRLRKTKLFHYDRDWFMAQLCRDIEALERKAHREGLVPVIRLNGTSDIDWENIKFEGQSLMERYSWMKFYDYTKLPRVPKNNNYHLTFSYSAAPKFQRSVKKAERLGMNMAVVSSLPMPETWHGRKVINGDEHDLRFLDPDDCIIWLKPKGPARKSDSNLIVRVAA